MRKPNPTPKGPASNAIATAALDAIRKINEEAEEKKLAQFKQLHAAKEELLARIEEINHQIAQIDKALGVVTKSPEKRARMNLDDVRARITNWMAAHPRERFAAGDLVRQFPELEGKAVSTVLKPLVNDGKIAMDVTEGARRAKYLVP